MMLMKPGKKTNRLLMRIKGIFDKKTALMNALLYLYIQIYVYLFSQNLLNGDYVL